MVVLNKNAFRLPRVEKEKFILLLRLGLDYDKVKGTFCISSYNNIDKLMDTISEILNDSNVYFMQSCTICAKDFPCQDCKYIEMCTSKNLPFHCVCPQCLKEGKTTE